MRKGPEESLDTSIQQPLFQVRSYRVLIAMIERSDDCRHTYRRLNVREKWHSSDGMSHSTIVNRAFSAHQRGTRITQIKPATPSLNRHFNTYTRPIAAGQRSP
jgi:hypothetical protein